jgi:hypothetical protein
MQKHINQKEPDAALPVALFVMIDFPKNPGGSVLPMSFRNLQRYQHTIALSS